MLDQNVGRVKGRAEGSIPARQCVMDGPTCANELEADRPRGEGILGTNVMLVEI